ncbi:MAG: hypothetical protein P1U88_15195 [Thalassobaculaceae bacterium]|nr:hypothetical protein [Thalassobaculaceae bacterium]
MNSGSSKTDARREGGARSGGDYLRRYDDDGLTNHLMSIRGRVREIMHEFNIPMGHICEMANQAEQRITDTAVRAEFLHALIEVHEFGREAKRRDVAVVEKGETPDVLEEDAEGAPETPLFAPTTDATDKVSDHASRDFFASLDGPRRPDRPTSKRRAP